MKLRVMFMACLAMLFAMPSFAQNNRNTEVLHEVQVAKNDIVKRSILQEKEPLGYAPLREADIFWESNLWRVVDVREKMNLAFTYPKAPLFSILSNAVSDGTLQAYSTESEDFSIPITAEEIRNMMSTRDTIVVVNPLDYTETIKIVENTMNWEDVKRFRLQEKWYFDAKTSTMKVRILGIAPLREHFDAQGNFKYEAPMFWINYAEARPVLATERVFNIGGNQGAKTSWEDLFEMRYFSSYVIKNENIHDRRLEDYLSGTEALVEGQRIEDALFNYEQDFWVK